MTQLATIAHATIQPIINMGTNAVTSAHTKRAYGRALTDFMAWHSSTGQPDFSQATVPAHVPALRVQTTEHDIGGQQDLYSAPCDALGLKL